MSHIFCVTSSNTIFGQQLFVIFFTEKNIFLQTTNNDAIEKIDFIRKNVEEKILFNAFQFEKD